jgi:hypothetical protein
MCFQVLEVAKEQLSSGLKNNNSNFEEFRKNLKTYSQVTIKINYPCPKNSEKMN